MTNETGSTVNIDLANIVSYKQYWLTISKRYAYQITPTEGTTMCLTDDTQDGGIDLHNTGPVVFNSTCGWAGYELGTFTPYHYNQMIILMI